ncbi:PH domain-containing protein [Nocardia callitridis]|uniref:PH domain-containing protein n=1 Tax=Nocardia callitridis TaxID=648753 RepID=A0ABP9JRI1_9NOCA
MSEPVAGTQDQQPWLRLDKRMLLVYPVTELVKYIPVLVVTVILGTNNGNPLWGVIPLVLVVGFALARWFTTTYRVGPTHIELRTGVLQRKKLSVPRARVRSVDIEADLLHRALGLSVLAIGTGQQTEDKDKFKLDALDATLVPALRAELLAHTAGAPEPADSTESRESLSDNTSDTSPPLHEIGHWQPSWVRYAPLSLTGFAIIGPLVGVAFQVGLGEKIFASDAVHNVGSGGVLAIALGIVALLVAIVVVVSLLACLRYLTTYFGLRVTENGRTLQLRHGLFTTRQITLDLARFRGATLQQPLLLRLADAAELRAIMTGASPSQKILPQAPRAAVEHTLSHLLSPTTVGDNEKTLWAPDDAGPVRVPLIAHGPLARRRRYIRAMVPVEVVAVALLVITLVIDGVSPWWWLLPILLVPPSIALAEDRYRGLGHAVIPATATTPTWLITRSGSLDRNRDCLEAPGIIGWTVHQTFFQRRLGLATVIAATAAGSKHYFVVDIPLDDAWQLIESVTPGRLGVR